MGENNQESFLENHRRIENLIGKDKKDFIPIWGIWNYHRRAWPIIKNEPIVENENDDLYFGYDGLFFLTHIAYCIPAIASSAYIILKHYVNN